MIGISTPGIINDGFVSSSNVNGFGDIDLYNILTQRYQQSFIITNDVNTAAVGYYASQDRYSSITFLFQPTSFYAGAGTIINGQLIKGRLHLAGEVQYLPLNLSNDKLQKEQLNSLQRQFCLLSALLVLMLLFCLVF